MQKDEVVVVHARQVGGADPLRPEHVDLRFEQALRATCAFAPRVRIDHAYTRADQRAPDATSLAVAEFLSQGGGPGGDGSGEFGGAVSPQYRDAVGCFEALDGF